MRVLVELLDAEPVKNVLALSVFKPEVVLYLCDERDTSFFKESTIYRFLRRRNLRTRPRFYYFDASDPVAVKRILWAVLRDWPGCVFDFSGGQDLVLLLAGTFAAELDLPGFYIDFPQGRFVDIRHCAKLAARFEMPRFSAGDLFATTGAGIHGYSHVDPTEISPGFEQDVMTVFRMVQKNPKAWGEFVTYLQACCAGTPAAQLDVSGAKTMVGERHPLRYNPVILQHLADEGLLTQYSLSGPSVQFTFKDALTRRCLLNNGIWLELYCYVTAKNTHWFDEVQTGVVIDWDDAEPSTKNEVDVLLIKGVTSVFISCKMSLPSALALSEIKLLSMKFGGRFSRTILLTAARLTEDNRPLRTRAADLGILLLDRGDLAGNRLAERLIEAASAP